MSEFEMTKEGYLLLFHSNEWWKNAGLEELQKYMTQSSAWMEELIASGKAKAGQALARTGVIVSGKNGRSISDGPFAESKEIIGGYLLLNVETFEEAVAIAKSCPGLAYGGSLEVRPLTDVCPTRARLDELMREERLATA